MLDPFFTSLLRATPTSSPSHPLGAVALKSQIPYPPFFEEYLKVISSFAIDWEQLNMVIECLTDASLDLDKPTPPADAVSAEKAAGTFFVSPRTIQGWARKGWLRRWKVGRRYVFSKAEVLAIAMAYPSHWTTKKCLA